MSDEPQEFSQFPVNQELSSDQKIELLTQMMRIRRFEQVSLKHYQGGKIGGFLHLYIGQEAVAVGTISLKGDNDHFITAYRDHGHALAVGMGMNECMAEMFGKQSGCSKGKGGSMHFFAPDKNFWGGHGIVAGQTPLGLGLGYGLKYQNKRGCCLCYLGDGAVNQGAFHESLNLAKLFEIPVVYVIENNGYSMGTSQVRSSAQPEFLAQRAEAYDMDWDIVDGSNLYEVRAKTHVAMERARNEFQPTILEINTYRYYGHSIADANHKKYRTPEEIEDYKQNHDPINVFQRKLIDEGVITDEQVAEITKAVYWETDNETEASTIGRHFFGD
jgi:pyruvate dehydrogenase E1 component alpha subunit